MRAAAVEASIPFPVVPRLRGRLHFVAFGVSLLGLVWLVALANGARALAAAWIYGLATVLLYLVSSSYHMFARGPRVRTVMRRLDHSMIFVLIAGTYTPVCLLALDGWLGVSLLVAVWIGALIGIVLKVVGLERYRKISAPLYIVLGWLALVAAPQFIHRLALVPLAVAGGLLYTVGAVLFALQWPRRVAVWFGYHEWWHVFVVAAGACFFAMNAYLIATA